MKRKFYNTLISWKERGMEKPLMVLGARQVGKTYIIDKFCKENFKEYIYINLLENVNVKKIFEEELNFDVKVEKLEVELKEKLVNETGDKIVFFDEIQESEELISDLKAFQESDIKYNIVVAGSLLRSKIKKI